MSHNLQNTTEHKAYKAYNHTQSFSPAGTQCLTSTIHNTQGLCYLPGCFRPQSPTTQAKLCAFARNPPAAQSLHLFQCTELGLLHEQYKDICPIIYKTQQNTELVIEHRASFIIFIEHRASFIIFPGLKKLRRHIYNFTCIISL